MNPTPEQIENVLRSAPVPRSPAGLKERILARVRAGESSEADAFPGVRSQGARRIEALSPWRRWLPLLLPAGVVAAVASALVVQQNQIEDERAALGNLLASGTGPQGVEVNPVAVREAVAVPDERAEMERLRERVSQLLEEAQATSLLEQENADLKRAIAAAIASLPKEYQEAAALEDRASSIRCVNNLKQIGLAFRIWANDNQGEYPSDFLSTSNELATPKILVCPSDTGRSPAESWEQFSVAHASYELLSAGPGRHELEPNRVLTRCPIHGNVGLCDGSVQMGMAKTHPDSFVTRNGVLYMEQTSQPAPAPGGGPGNRDGTSDEPRPGKTASPAVYHEVPDDGSGVSASPKVVFSTNAVMYLKRTVAGPDGRDSVVIWSVKDPVTGELIEERVVGDAGGADGDAEGEVHVEIIESSEPATGGTEGAPKP